MSLTSSLHRHKDRLIFLNIKAKIFCAQIRLLTCRDCRVVLIPIPISENASDPTKNPGICVSASMPVYAPI